jgi:hypothetical protein
MMDGDGGMSELAVMRFGSLEYINLCFYVQWFLLHLTLRSLKKFVSGHRSEVIQLSFGEANQSIY